MNNLILFFAAVFIEIATAIAQVNHVFDGHLWAAYCLYALAGVFILWEVLNYFTGKQSQRESLPPSSQRNDQRVEANPQQTVIIGSDLLRTTASQPQLQRAPIKPEIPEIKPRSSRLATLGDLCPQSESQDVYVVVPFRNESLFRPDCKYTAHVAYKRADGSEIAEVLTASWFPLEGNPGNTTLPAKQTRQLAVLRVQEGKLLTGKIEWIRQRVFHQYIWKPEPCSDEITESIDTIEVTLHGHNLLLKFIFDINEDGKSLHWREE